MLLSVNVKIGTSEHFCLRPTVILLFGSGPLSQLIQYVSQRSETDGHILTFY